jgi:HSP20 family protein
VAAADARRNALSYAVWLTASGVFANAGREATVAAGALERWFGDFSSSRFQPRIDVVDEGKILRVTVELPGMERDDLTVSVEDGALVLRGEKKQDVHSEEDGCYRLERAYGVFTRTIPMPDNADPDHALAKFDKGVLTLTVPKREQLRSASRTIDIG